MPRHSGNSGMLCNHDESVEQSGDIPLGSIEPMANSIDAREKEV